jgi:addiction module RelE/StbE family toxin
VIVFDEEALGDLERIFEFNFDRDPAAALQHIERIREAVHILDAHPEIGRRAGRNSSLRELVISHGASGYIALYEHSPAEELIRVAAIRHQREAGYR